MTAPVSGSLRTRPYDVGIVHGVEGERGDRVALGMDAHVLGEVEVREDVAVQDEEAVGEEPLVGGEADRPRGAERLGLFDVAHAAARPGSGRREPSAGPQGESRRP